MLRQWHRPGVFACVLTLAGVAFFVLLGLWQVRRAHEKEALFAAFDTLATQTPIPLAQARRQADAVRYPRVEVSGHYDSEHAYVLDNQVRGGHSGVMVFDVFEPTDGSVPLLVNRGFLARDARGERPAIPAPPTGAQVLSAIYAPPPGAGIKLGGNPLPAQRTWPKLTIYLDLADIDADLGRQLDRRVLLLLAQAGTPFVREWRPQVFPPQRHYAYAFTWFTFALVSLVLFVIVHWRKDEIPT